MLGSPCHACPMPDSPYLTATARGIRCHPMSWQKPRRSSSANTGSPSSAGAAVPRPNISEPWWSASVDNRCHPAVLIPSPARLRSTNPCRSGRTPRTCRWASAQTQMDRKHSAKRCWPRIGKPASRLPANKSATARTCLTSALTMSVAMASPTWMRWHVCWPPPRHCRSCSIAPNPK